MSPFLQGLGTRHEGMALPRKGGRKQGEVYRPGPDVLGKLSASDVLRFRSLWGLSSGRWTACRSTWGSGPSLGAALDPGVHPLECLGGPGASQQDLLGPFQRGRRRSFWGCLLRWVHRLSGLQVMFGVSAFRERTANGVPTRARFCSREAMRPLQARSVAPPLSAVDQRGSSPVHWVSCSRENSLASDPGGGIHCREKQEHLLRVSELSRDTFPNRSKFHSFTGREKGALRVWGTKH